MQVYIYFTTVLLAAIFVKVCECDPNVVRIKYPIWENDCNSFERRKKIDNSLELRQYSVFKTRDDQICEKMCARMSTCGQYMYNMKTTDCHLSQYTWTMWEESGMANFDHLTGKNYVHSWNIYNTGWKTCQPKVREANEEYPVQWLNKAPGHKYMINTLRISPASLAMEMNLTREACKSMCSKFSDCQSAQYLHWSALNVSSIDGINCVLYNVTVSELLIRGRVAHVPIWTPPFHHPAVETYERYCRTTYPEDIRGSILFYDGDELNIIIRGCKYVATDEVTISKVFKLDKCNSEILEANYTLRGFCECGKISKGSRLIYPSDMSKDDAISTGEVYLWSEGERKQILGGSEMFSNQLCFNKDAMLEMEREHIELVPKGESL